MRFGGQGVAIMSHSFVAIRFRGLAPLHILHCTSTLTSAAVYIQFRVSPLRYPHPSPQVSWLDLLGLT